ncbi:MAG: AIR synthase family protein [Lachnospiraceae bacterium]|nr:AIR synthase family protein [Lachnospiraceae bacterium]MDD3616847.1 AIR synthase family protein [Lachnospiraceae bacterium]
MKIGKLAEPILIRSVIKQLSHRRDEVLSGPAVGQDCGVIEVEPDEVIVMSTDPITGTTKDIGAHSVYITVNDLAAAGSEPIGIMLSIMLPERISEQKLRIMMQDVEDTCAKLNIEVIGGHTEITNVVNQPVITVTGVGKTKKSELMITSQIKANQDIVVTKWIGLEATAILAKEKEEELLKRYPKELVDTARDFASYLSVVEEAKIAKAHGASAMHDITEGGVFGALWEMASSADLGLEVDLKAIPIRQETVEVCEYFGLNPYQIMSSGSMMIATDDGAGLVRKLEEKGIHGSVVGRTNDGNDRILMNGEEQRYLDRPQPDELYKVMG